MGRFLAATALALAIAGSAGSRMNAGADPVVTVLLDRVAEKVVAYYQRVQTIVSTETVRMQPLAEGLTPAGAPLRLTYETRTEWKPAQSRESLSESTTTRRLVSSSGKEPRTPEGDTCIAPDPLFMLLPERRREFGFSLGAQQKVDGRNAVIIDFISLPTGKDKLMISDDCVNIPLDGRTRGHVWVDLETDEVLKLENHLVGIVEVRVPRDPKRDRPMWLNLERWDYSIKFSRVKFEDPDETVTLPSSIETVTVLRGANTTRTRVTQSYADYQRFLTDSRVIHVPSDDRP